MKDGFAGLKNGGGVLALGALALLVVMTTVATPAVAETRFVFANESPYDTLDPHAAFDVGRVAVRLNLYDGLYRWLDNPAVLNPWLAESHTVSPDGLHLHVQAASWRQVPRWRRGHGAGRPLPLDRILAREEGRRLAPRHHGRRRARPRRWTSTRCSSP